MNLKLAFLLSLVVIITTSLILQADRGGGARVSPYDIGIEQFDNCIPLFRFLDTNGDGTGTKNVIGDYDATPTTFFITPPVGGTYHLHRMIIQLEDNAVVWNAEHYGGAQTALVNGFYLEVSSSVPSRDIDLMDGGVINANGDYGRYCYDVNLTDFGIGNYFFDIRWSFDKSGAPLVLKGGQDTLKIDFTDDFTSLVSHTFVVQGVKFLN